MKSSVLTQGAHINICFNGHVMPGRLKICPEGKRWSVLLDDSGLFPHPERLLLTLSPGQISRIELAPDHKLRLQL